MQEHAPGVRRTSGTGELTIVTPVVPVLVGDDWKAALFWKALYEKGVFVNTALAPGRAARRRAAADERDGNARRDDDRSGARGLRDRQARVRVRARAAALAARG